MLASTQHTVDFELPDHLEKPVPTEIRRIARDEVRLMVSRLTTDSIFHTSFRKIGRFLRPGDTLLVNTSATLPAALDIVLPSGHPGCLHLSNQLQDKIWLAEIRQLIDSTPRRYHLGQAGDLLALPGGGQARLIRPFFTLHKQKEHLHLWEIELTTPKHVHSYLAAFGKAIRYDEREYPIEYYQTAFTSEAGSAEMPSAGRAFTPQLITKLMVEGIQFAPLLLHTGVSSLEVGERPYPEYYEVPLTSASLVNQARKEGRRIIAVGTTAVRAIESAVDETGKVQAGNGWTEHYITPEKGLRIVDGLLTGFHEPRASHLQMLMALTGKNHLNLAYQAAIDHGYFWHEFGDLHLIL